MQIRRLVRDLLIKRYPLFTGCASCPQGRLPWRETRQLLPEPAFPIDLVFTWVDGSDPALAAKKAAYCASAGCGECLHNRDHFRNNQELRYSLRSWETYAPWVRKIFIVTDAQIPAWLRTDHPKVRVVDHTECIPAEYLPTFSSRVIEAHLHNISDLGEHFIYCNDDCFLLNRSTPSDFFTANGLPYILADWRTYRRRGYNSTPLTPHAASFHNTRSWLENHGIVPAPDVIVAHIPQPLTLSAMRCAYTFYEEAVRCFGRDRFRTSRGMVFPCHAVPLLSYSLKQAVPRDMPYYYINSKRFDRKAYYAAMLKEKDLDTLPPFLCINDVGDAPKGHTWEKDMLDFLETYYPQPSQFERSL